MDINNALEQLAGFGITAHELMKLAYILSQIGSAIAALASLIGAAMLFYNMMFNNPRRALIGLAIGIGGFMLAWLVDSVAPTGGDSALSACTILAGITALGFGMAGSGMAANERRSHS